MSYFFPTSDECTHRTIFDSLHTTTMAGEHIQFSLVDIPPGGVVPSHSHPNEQLGLMISGALEFTIAEETKIVRAGDMYRIPGGVVHSCRALTEPVRVLDAFYPVRDEYR